MTDSMKEKREVLKILSRAVTHSANDEGLNLEEYTVNKLIMRYAYNPDLEFNFQSFKSWKNDGYTIKKGSRAYIVWGQPLSTKKEEQKQEEQKQEETEEDKKGDFFPVAYLFRNDQVIKPIRKIETIPAKTTAPIVVEDLPL